MAINSEHIGSTLDDLLAADGTLLELTKVAEDHVRAYQEQQARDGGATVQTPKRLERTSLTGWWGSPKQAEHDFDFPTLHMKEWPQEWGTLRREDMYSDDVS